MKNKVVAVTGANGNLGRAVVKTALDRGAEVVLLDLSFGADLPEPPKGRAKRYELDMLDQKATEECFNSIGPIDVLCNTAGGFAMGQPVHLTTDEDWTRMFDLNVRTLLNGVRTVVPGMAERGSGRIINVAAVGGLTGGALMAPYAAAKSVVMRITESMSSELKQRGINVNCVLPSIIDTPQNREAMPDEDFSTWVSPEQLADVICYLASAEASGLHGACIPVKNLV